MSLPLNGLLVVAVEQAAAAPYVTSRLADAGARVIKIERPEGDFARGYDNAVNGESTYFVWLNRGKESVVLDFKKPEDAELLQKLIAQADVFVQNLGPGAAKRAGFDWQTLREKHPRLITCDITGYGEGGPMSDKRAYDLLVQAESGIASVTGTAEAPGRIGISACDIGTGMYAHAAVLEALIKRGITGEGSAIHVSLFEAMCDWMAIPLLHYEYDNYVWPRVGLAHPSIAPYGVFEAGTTPEQKTSVLLGIQNDGEWRRFATEVLKDPQLAADPDYTTNQLRVKNKEKLNNLISQAFAQMQVEELHAMLQKAQIAFSSVNTVKELSSHPHLKRTPVQMQDEVIQIVAPPATFRGEERTLGPVPSLGAHTDSIREEFG